MLLQYCLQNSASVFWYSVCIGAMALLNATTRRFVLSSAKAAISSFSESVWARDVDICIQSEHN